MRGERTRSFLLAVVLFPVMLWASFIWMSMTGMRPTRRSYWARAATPGYIAAVRNLAVISTVASGLILWLTREKR